MRSILSGVFAILIAAFAAMPSHAQSIILTPAVVTLAGKNGQSVTQLLTLRNESDQELEFVLDARDVIVRDGARVFVEPGALADSIASSAIFVPNKVRIAPRSSGSTSVTLTLPHAMRHRAVATYFRGTTVVKSGKRQARLNLGTLFTFAVSDKFSVSAAALEATPPSSVANAQLKSRLVNDGTEPVVPAGTAVLLDDAGRMVGKMAFRETRLLPGEAATVAADYPGELSSGSYRAIATFDIAGKPLTLTASLRVP
jgi:hypothetical protein